jgi:hypothetical protein
VDEKNILELFEGISQEIKDNLSDFQLKTNPEFIFFSKYICNKFKNSENPNVQVFFFINDQPQPQHQTQVPNPGSNPGFNTSSKPGVQPRGSIQPQPQPQPIKKVDIYFLPHPKIVNRKV